MKHLLAFLISLLLAVPAFSHNVKVEDGCYIVTHEWTHSGRQWSCSIPIPMDLYYHFQGRAHQSDDMVQFVLSDYDREWIESLAGWFDGDRDNVISFVQSLRYVSDRDSKNVKDYVRFPVETLVDGCGDCEDLAILAAAILDAMGFRILLVNLPNHLALAVDCPEGCSGTYYEYNGREYYYLEVTNPGWAIGQIPNEFRSSRATLSPLLYQPKVRLRRSHYSHDSYSTSASEVPYELRCELENPGPGTTEGLSIRIIFTTRRGAVKVNRLFTLDDLHEGESGTYELNVNVPRPFFGTMEVRTEGLNFSPESMKFDNIELE